MEKKISSKSTSSLSALSAATTQTLQCTGSATGNPRNKCALKPGHSLMDWIKLGNSGADLSGTGGRVIPISKEELLKHNTRNDAWMAIRGFVFNVTRYMEFHPGGVEEIMRGVGTDATKLFNETHAWVNYSQLLNKCCIGPLTGNSRLKCAVEKPITLPDDNPFAKPPGLPVQADIVPRLDWIQTRDNITLYFYTKQFCNPGLLISNPYHGNNHLEMCVLIGLYVYKFKFELQGRIKWPPKKSQISTESGKIEVKLTKHNESINLWSGLGKYIMSKILADALDSDTSLEFQVIFKNKFNNDSFVMMVKNENIIYIPPVGYHLIIENVGNCKKIDKCYTPVPKNYATEYINTEMDTQYEYMYFLIKFYQNPNSFSKYLYDLKKNETIKVSLPRGNLKLSVLAMHRKFCFLAAGSGLTPFLGLINHLLNRNTNRIEVIKTFYFNKTKRDIWCNEKLTNLSSKDPRFEIVNILSSADESWSGLKGRVSTELLYPIANKSMENCFYIAACGPFNFITSVKQILNEFNFPNENLFTF